MTVQTAYNGASGFANPTDVTGPPSAATARSDLIDVRQAAGTNQVDTSAPPGSSTSENSTDLGQGFANPTDVTGPPSAATAGSDPIDVSAAAGTNQADTSAPPGSGTLEATTALGQGFANPTDVTGPPSAARAGSDLIDVSKAAGTNQADTAGPPGSSTSEDSTALGQGFANPTDVAGPPSAATAGSDPINVSKAAGTNQADTSGPPGSGPSSATPRPVNLSDNSADICGPPGDPETGDSEKHEPINPTSVRGGLNPSGVAHGPAMASPARATTRDSSRSKKTTRPK